MALCLPQHITTSTVAPSLYRTVRAPLSLSLVSESLDRPHFSTLPPNPAHSSRNSHWCRRAGGLAGLLVAHVLHARSIDGNVSWQRDAVSQAGRLGRMLAAYGGLSGCPEMGSEACGLVIHVGAVSQPGLA